MKSFTVLTFVIATLIAAGEVARAQAVYLEDGQSGAAAAAGFESADNDAPTPDATVLSLAGAYTYRALVDVGFGIHFYDFEDTDTDATGFAPSLTVHVIRQNTQIPVSVVVGASYEHLSFSDEPPGVDLSAWILAGAAGVYRRIVTGQVVFSPQINLGFAHTESKVETILGDEEDDDTSLVFQLHGNLGFLLGGATGAILAVDPLLSISEDTTAFGVVAGVVFRL